MSDFITMGGYAAFVWPAFALSALVLIALLVTSVKALRESERALDALGANAAREERSA